MVAFLPIGSWHFSSWDENVSRKGAKAQRFYSFIRLFPKTENHFHTAASRLPGYHP
jgi:hypothetical protein